MLDIKGILSKSDYSIINKKYVKTEKLELRTSDCKIYERNRGYYYLDIEDLQPSGSPGYPMMPMKSIVFKLPKNAKITDVVMTNANYKEIANKFRITPMPEPMFFEDDDSAYEGYLKNVLEPRVKLYASDDFYPGEILSYSVGKSNRETLVIVQVYPVQYIPRNSELVLITEGEINVLYESIEEDTKLCSSSTDAVNVILTPEKFYDQAVDLKNFHDNQGTLTEVVNTSWINSNYEPSEDPPYIGYKLSLIHI